MRVEDRRGSEACATTIVSRAPASCKLLQLVITRMCGSAVLSCGYGMKMVHSTEYSGCYPLCIHIEGKCSTNIHVATLSHVLLVVQDVLSFSSHP